MDDADAPLLAAWRRAVDGEIAPFTIPGHNRRAGSLWPTLGRAVDSDVPLYAGLDTMKCAAATLSAAEQQGAALWGADWCRYSTGGSTQVNQVAALALGPPDSRVLVARTAHRSTLSGLILAGLEPVWLPTEVDERFGLPTGISVDAVERALHDHPDVVGVICVEPSYVGTLSPLADIVAAAHRHGVPVAVDQAWAGHFGFHPGYPPHALQVGADIMITSAHKVLPAYSQAAVIAARTERLDGDRLDRAFDVLTTTSQSGSILASIDAARALLAAPLGCELLGRLLDLVASARERLRAGGLHVPGPDDFSPGRFDPAKLVVTLDTADGLAVEDELIAAGMPVEQADRDTIVAIVTMIDDADSIDRLCTHLLAAAERAATPPRQHVPSAVWTAAIPPAAISPRTAFFARHELVPAELAIGRVSAELIAPYPPGIPVLAPGELVTMEVIAALRAARAAGVRIAYASDPALASFRVVVE
jgi:arginine decarboxylase